MLVSAVHYAFESLQSIFGFPLCHHCLKFHALYILIFKEIDSMNTKKLDLLKGPSTSPFKFYLNDSFKIFSTLTAHVIMLG